MSTLEFEEIATPRPATKAPRANTAAGRAAHPEDTCDVAIVGAGPYGLSLAAHLRELGVSFRIFGKPLDTWRAHMPFDMLLKSEGCASNLSHPSSSSTLQAYCADRGIAYAHHNLPVSLDLFLEYADWFREKCVPTLEDKTVMALTRHDGRYRLTLDDGEHVWARRVVLAIRHRLVRAGAANPAGPCKGRRVAQFRSSRRVAVQELGRYCCGRGRLRYRHGGTAA